MAEQDSTTVLELATGVVAAYLSKNRVPVSTLPDLIASISASISGLVKPARVEAPPPVPAVNPKKSVTPDHIVCLEDGKRFKSLKRHLRTLGMSPTEYRAKWNLPANYPMVAPSYSAQRSDMAKALGLGRKSAPVEVANPVRKTAKAAAASAPAPKKPAKPEAAATTKRARSKAA